ncbi:MAG: sporulation protein [Chitinivibrionales bacterium]|nr:sporulation protein [Chitinivibrionales bacterium]MBD3396867.1 sporulation protein [Chitinivibrionales bacterium]
MGHVFSYPEWHFHAPPNAGRSKVKGNRMSLSEVIKTALDQIQFIAKTETVIGEPIHSGSVTLIPVSKVSIGFAAGGGGKEEKAGSGAGTGGGINVTPVAFIVITGGKVQVHPVEKGEIGLDKILALAPDLIQKLSKYMKNRESKDKSRKD